MSLPDRVTLVIRDVSNIHNLQQQLLTAFIIITCKFTGHVIDFCFRCAYFDRWIIVHWKPYLGLLATSQADTMTALTAMSTGTMLAAGRSGSPCSVLIKPPPAPTTAPVGPYTLSIQPHTGSSRVDTTATESPVLIRHTLLLVQSALVDRAQSWAQG
jgi:hypothetical protein